ncbi:unnamed protein product [Effrenium voratum]|uniref:Uncharacterized protein n=1 Tax=Effrenium voratum TaxID=2562239 RepID=A0AA36HML7_9DINO|nr:unnamed protein product [Effrenium voratum]CAJ1449634.1 unnamed protein product [Effrenium voratum]
MGDSQPDEVKAVICEFLPRPSQLQISLAPLDPSDWVPRFDPMERSPLQFLAVCRHAERADDVGALVQGLPWCLMQDSQQWPYDPPLSDAGLVAAEELGQKLQRTLKELDSELHVVVTSPFLRCVQTAALICRQVRGTRLLIDNSLGEIYGPCIMGDQEPLRPVRPLTASSEFCSAQGVECLEVGKLLGKWPLWPETLREARRRFANRFTEYLKRGSAVHRNFVLVSHADCVGAALALIPAGTGRHNIEKVHFGGHFVALRPKEVEKEEVELDRALFSVERRLLRAHAGCEEPLNTHHVTRGGRTFAAAYIRREEALQAVCAKREWSGIQGFTQDAQMMMDVSDLGSHPGCENGISLGEGWRLQISGVVVRGRRKSLAMPSPQEGLEVVREWGVPLLLSAPEVAPEGQRWQVLEALPEAPLGLEERRRSSGRFSVHSLELFAGSASMMTCEQMTPRPTLGTMDCTEDMEAHDVWEGQEIGHVRTDSYLVAQNSLAPPGSQRPSIIRRRSRTASTPEVVPEGVVLEGAGAPVVPGAVLLGKEAKLQSDDQSSEVKEDTPRLLVLPSVASPLRSTDESQFLPDKSPLYQRRRRKGICSEDSIANLSTSDGSN